MDYNFGKIEEKWQGYWDKEKTFKISFRLIGVYDILLGVGFILFFRKGEAAKGVAIKMLIVSALWFILAFFVIIPNVYTDDLFS